MSGDDDSCKPPATHCSLLNDESVGLSQAGSSREECSADKFKTPHNIEAFGNADVELELSGEWEAGSGREDSKCVPDHTTGTSETACIGDGVESEGWASDLDTNDQENRSSLGTSQLSTRGNETIDMVDTKGIHSFSADKLLPKYQRSEEEIIDILSGKEPETVQVCDDTSKGLLSDSKGMIELKDSKVDNSLEMASDGVYMIDDRMSPAVNISASDHSVSLDADYYDSDTPNTSNVETKKDLENHSEENETNHERAGYQSARRTLEPINEELTDGIQCDSDAEEKDQEPLDLYLPSSPVSKEADLSPSAKINRFESLLIAQAGEQSPASVICVGSDAEDLESEAGSPVFKTYSASGNIQRSTTVKQSV